MKMGTLYAVGMGPGSPDLLTLRAVRILSRISVVLAASSANKEYSRALEIARPHLPENIEIITLDFPMTRDAELLKDAWTRAAGIARDILVTGKNAAFLTLGDPMIYSTFAYLQNTLLNFLPEANIEIIPGITSFQVAASISATPLCTGNRPFTLISGIADEQQLIKLLENPGASAILKVYRNYQHIENALAKTGRLKQAVAFSELGLPKETIQGLPLKEKPGYMTLILSPKPGE